MSTSHTTESTSICHCFHTSNSKKSVPDKEGHADLELNARKTPVRSYDSEAFLLHIDSGEQTSAGGDKKFEETFVRV